MEIQKGMIVRANAGRDKGRFFAVIGFLNEKAFIADGKTRKLENPKRKNIRHLSLTSHSICTETLTDKKLRNILSEFNK